MLLFVGIEKDLVEFGQSYYDEKSFNPSNTLMNFFAQFWMLELQDERMVVAYTF